MSTLSPKSSLKSEKAVQGYCGKVPAVDLECRMNKGGANLKINFSELVNIIGITMASALSMNRYIADEVYYYTRV